ncbi:Na+/H+ antiporter [Sphingobacterium faecium NBRC 15299]|uniref:Na+/H+ antiporter n=1 Tax=Sphingobacterium faecium TaxID=34087 RepID=UPI000D334DE8|nr:Na+/H+ antiporter [Sphingobacterium faecium]PTX10285.1 sodium/proton antiporter (CPA1 family) [Sphingobacterium faecium]GEM64410.1 Na+/H+ antiporter [Sphingobacterium faecium NBRC 15299]
MLENFEFYLFLVLMITMLIMLAKKIQVAYPVLLVLAGLLISFIPGVPRIKIEPELIFILFLPPLLYEAAWSTSWKELWRWRRIIFSFAFVVVFFTALSVAIFANYFIPGFSLALGFLLGGIVSPPDAVSAGAILKFVKVPKRLASILEGESLLNDASSLIIFRFAMIAAATGQFVWQEAAGSFVWMCIGGVGIGLAIAYVFLKMHKILPTDSNTDILLTFIAPFSMYLAAEQLHASGVLAVVSGGLFLSYRSHDFLSSASRIRTVTVWETFVFLLNGIVFMLIGLDLPEIVSGLGDTDIYTAIGYGIAVTGVLVMVRVLAGYAAVITTLIMRNFITVADAQSPGWKTPMIIGWTGMRGVVSLAAALSIPLTLSDGTPFPQRNLILFITFVVILLTLLVQGLTLPILLKKFPLIDRDFVRSEKEIDYEIQNNLAQVAVDKIRNDYANKIESFPILKDQLEKYEHQLSSSEIIINYVEYRNIYIDILETQRSWLINKNRQEILLDEEIIKKHLRLLDLQEERLNLKS